MNSSTRTVPASHTRPRSLRSRSISMTCSARSLGWAASSLHLARVIARDGGCAAACRRWGACRRARPLTRTSRSGEELRIATSCHCASAANGAGLARAQPLVEAGRGGQRAARGVQLHVPGARQVGLVDVPGAHVLLRAAHALEVSLRILLAHGADRCSVSAGLGGRGGGERSAAICASTCGASALGDRQHAARAEIVDQRAAGAQREGLPGQRRARQRQVRLDLLRELVAEKERPAAGEGAARRLPA